MASSDLEKQPLLAGRSPSDEPAPEPTLSELQQNVFRAQREYMRAWSRTTNGKWHKSIMIVVTVLLSLFLVFFAAVIFQDAVSDDDAPMLRSGKVQLEAHIMSKCPDARDCLHDMVLPAMMNVSSMVDFKLSYIGSYVQRFAFNPVATFTDFGRLTDHDDGVLCMHGPQECLGNIIELCAAALYPDPKMYLGFTMCLSRDYDDIPKKELIQECALEHGISFQKLNDCAVADDGSLSVEMLRDSFQRSFDADVTKSCTIRLQGNVFCVRDDGEWKECDKGSKAADLVAEVERIHSAPRLRLGRGW